ncbi:MAG: gephyrin-like molybdotransferase Glp [Bacillota bacterium]|nr:gephyrin-like molybdotransferase Glp [Bacillota bacterium]
MAEFLKVLDYREAKELIIRHFPKRDIEWVSINRCHKRKLAADIISPEDIPAFPRSTVDGYAVKAADTFGCSESFQAFLDYKGEVVMGEEPAFTIEPGQCGWIPTGGMLPAGTDAVVMVEYTEKLTDTILVSRPVAPGENIMQKGEDVSEGSLLFAEGVTLRAQEIGMLASLGICEIPVWAPLRVGIISTGDEIIPIDQKPEGSQVRDINSYTLAISVEEAGGIVKSYPIIKDQFDKLQTVVTQALSENDCILLSGGSSVGLADYSLDVLLSLPDSQLLFHGIAVKPGKPAMGVRIGDKLVVGLPGHPVSALMVFHVLCASAMGKDEVKKQEAILTENISSQAGRDDFIPAYLKREKDIDMVYPLLGKSGLMSILAKADGYLHVPYEKQGIKAGEKVILHLFE